MTHELNRICQGIFCFLLLSLQWTTGFCVEDYQIVNQRNIVLRAKLGETCLDKICEENLLCNDDPLPVCECRPGFKVSNNECVPGNFEPCETNEDCCGHLVCINGICRKPVPNSEFITIAKICLGITVTTIIIAVFSSLIKCLIRYDNSRVFQRHSNTSNFNSTLPRQTVDPPYVNSHLDMYNIMDEKPPSYEECVRANGRSHSPLEPPPYIISSNTVTSTTETSPTVQSTNLSVGNLQNSTTPLNVQSLSDDVNSNTKEAPISGESHSDTNNNSSP